MKWELAERYIKLVLNGFTLFDGDIYVSQAFLVYLGMKGSFASLISQSKQLRNGRWVPLTKNNFLYIKLDSIPSSTLTKLSLDFPQDYLKDLLITSGKCEDEKVLDQVKKEAYLILQKEVANFRRYTFTFYNEFSTKDEREMYALNYAILKVILAFVEKYPKGLIDYFYELLKSEIKEKHSIPIDSKNYFYKYITRMKRSGLPNGLIHANKNKPSNNLKLTDTMKQLIIYLKSYGNFTSCREIRNALLKIKNNELSTETKLVSESTIRNFLSTHEADNLTLLSRQGYRKFEEKILGYLPLNRTQNPLTKILIDGYTVQVVCEGDNSKPEKLTLFTIMDSYSGYVVIEVGEREDYHLVRKAFEKFLYFSQYKLPLEIVSDFHSSYQSKYFDSFRKFLVENNVKWIASQNPKRKAQLERWFGTLQQVYLTKISGYIGEGIKSKRKDAHPPEEVQLIVKSKEYLKSKNEVTRLLLSAAEDYNRNAYFKDAASPLDLYHLKKPIYFIQLQDYHIPYFFWDKHRVSINGSMVIIKTKIAEAGGKEKSTKWFYRNADLDFALKNGIDIDAYHNTNDDESLYLFERNSLKFIGIMKKQLTANEALHDQTEIDRKIIADFGISKAKLHQAYIQCQDNLEQTLKDKFGIDPIELRLKADFKKQAEEYDGYKVGIGKKKKEPDLTKSYKSRQGRRATRRAANKKDILPIRDTLG